MDWNVAQVKQKLSEVLRAAAREPQRIFNRKELVGAVVSRETFEDFLHWQRVGQRSIGAELAELRTICAEEGDWELATPSRQDRLNPMLEALEDATLRHEHSE